MGWFSRKTPPIAIREPNPEPNSFQLTAMVDHGADLIDRGQENEAIALLTLPAKAGIPDGMFNLAIAYLKRGSVTSAMYWYENAALAGHVDAMAYLGYLFRIKGETSLARKWLAKAARAGNSNAATMVRDLDFDPDSQAAAVVSASSMATANFHANVGRLDLARRGWLAAANAGNVEAMFELGKLQAIGGVFGEAMLWLERPAAAGHVDASRLLVALREGATSRSRP
ncbi:tetratricopeptide repeat protein [Georgenia faecalis]|uniref:Tetratricopeptide repeat protein n=1 Tax=Georgenia faecalis TaxID=2483799 RepID=A0ABV9D651_9MICO|nr:tetratricopeptide repeat protein [Georgenia faecalis]